MLPNATLTSALAAPLRCCFPFQCHCLSPPTFTTNGCGVRKVKGKERQPSRHAQQMQGCTRRHAWASKAGMPSEKKVKPERRKPMCFLFLALSITLFSASLFLTYTRKCCTRTLTPAHIHTRTRTHTRTTHTKHTRALSPECLPWP